MTVDKRLSGSAEERFWLRVNKLGPLPTWAPFLGRCWLWEAALDRRGYGAFGVGGKVVKAHRFAYESLVGPIPDGLEPDHLCRVLSCCRPDHLEPVTHAENMRRSPLAGVWGKSKTTCPEGHPYDEVDAQNGGRRCSRCRRAFARERTRRYRERKRVEVRG